MNERDHLCNKPRICPICLKAWRYFRSTESRKAPCGPCRREMNIGRAQEISEATVARAIEKANGIEASTGEQSHG